jgi:hypothetical protein
MLSPADSPSLPIRETEERAWRYWFSDGLATLVAGFTCLLIAWFLLLNGHKPATPFSIGVTFVLLGMYFVFLLRQRQIVEWLKSRITYPRTGYVRTPYFGEDESQSLDLTVLSMGGADATREQEWKRVHEDRKRRAVLAIVLSAGAMIALLLIRNPWICALTGAALSAALWIGARKDQRLSWIVLAGFPFLGVYLTIFRYGNAPGPDRAAYFLAGAGILFVAEGAVTLIRYLRKNPRPRENEA